MPTESKFKTAARERLRELDAASHDIATEAATILAIFPDLAPPAPTRSTEQPAPQKGTRRKRTAAERHAISIRMKRYHRKRRKEARAKGKQKAKT